MIIKKSVYEEIVAHGRADAPIEACGYLAEKDGMIVDIVRMKNADASPEHFSFIPAEQFAAARKIRSAGLRLSAVYHSHPASPARPSDEDIRLLSDPNLGYVIVSMAGEPPVVKLFRIRSGQVSEDPLNVIE